MPGLARSAITIVAGYALMAGIVALLGLLLPALGMAPADAVMVGVLLAVPLYLALILWGFHSRSLWRVAGVIGGGAALSIGAALLLAPV
jgi:hypothetical protein